MVAANLPIEAHVEIVSHAVVLSTGKRAQRHRVYIWSSEGSIQGIAVSFAVHGKRLDNIPRQNQQHCLDVLRTA